MLATRPFLFLGFSLAEPVLRRKLEEVLDITDHTAPIKFLLLRAGETDDAKRKEFFDKYNVQVIEFEQFKAAKTEENDATDVPEKQRCAYSTTIPVEPEYTLCLLA